MGLGGRRALAVGLPASVNAARVGVLRLKVKQERVPEPPRDHMPWIELAVSHALIRHVRACHYKVGSREM